MPIYSQYDVPSSSTMVNLGVGQPDTSKLPIDWFNTTLQKIANDNLSSEILQYGSISGYETIRTKLANWLSKKIYNNVEYKVDPDQLFMTNGNTGALQLIMNTMLENGDEIIIENPTYFLAKNMFDEYGLYINPVSMESDGINIEELEETICKVNNKLKEFPQNKIFLYTIPIHHNPTSITLSHEKRVQLARLCDKYQNFYVIADEVYHFLSFDNNLTVLPLADYHPNILSIMSFSKLIAPALRVGYIYQNTQHHKMNEDKFLLDTFKKCAILDSSGSMNPLGYLFLEKAFDDGSIDKIINNNIKILSERCNIMCEFLDNKKIKYMRPKGGYFLWLDLELDNTTKFLNFAMDYKVKFHAGIKFGDTASSSYIRLSYSFYDSADLIIGLERLFEAYNIYSKIKISVCGSTGHLGSLICTELQSNNDKYYLYEPITRDIKINRSTDVIIDVSSNDGTNNLIKYLNKNNIFKPVIIGTTGLSGETLALIDEYSIKNPVALISNFSNGINTIKKCITELNNLDWKFSLVEKHHTNKKDSPSGTAKELATLINKECIIESIREDDNIGLHEIKAQSYNEEIVLSHNALNRNIFAKGCIPYIDWILTKKHGLFHNMDYEYPDYEIYVDDDTTVLVTQNDYDYIYSIRGEKNIDYFVSIIELNNDNDNDSDTDIVNYELMIYNKKLETIKYNLIVERSVAKYVNKYFNKTEGNFINNKTNFKFNKNKIELQVIQPNNGILKDEFMNNVCSIVSQLSNLTVIGIGKYSHDDLQLVIEVNENITNMDTDVLTALGSIINSMDIKYNINFIYNNNNKLYIRSYSKNTEKEVFNKSGCITALEYILYNYVSYKPNFSTYVIGNDKFAYVMYNKKQYYYVE